MTKGLVSCRIEKMDYCKDALKLIGKKVICGENCPIIKNCPRIIMEDATDEAIDKAIEAMVKIKREKP